MRVCVGCSITRDARGDPGERTLIYAELTPEAARAHYAKFLRAAGLRPAAPGDAPRRRTEDNNREEIR